MKAKGRILTVREMLDIGERSSNIIIETYENGRLRCQCRGPVSNIKLNTHTDPEIISLSWSDECGNPDIALPTIKKYLDELIDNLPEMG
jgi:hypothetical protein